MREDEDFGGGDRVEPFLDPAPDGRKERGGPNDLGLSSVLDPVQGWVDYAHEDPIQCLWIMSCSKCTSILHVTPQVPELLQSDL